MVVQLVREIPPGHGGVERVAHELAEYWGTPVFSLDAKGVRKKMKGNISTSYECTTIRRLVVSRFAFPLPCRGMIRLLQGKEAIIAHLPCPGILVLTALAKLMCPSREVTIYWHAFLETDSSPTGRFTALYQSIALLATKRMPKVFTTSPTLKHELIKNGCKKTNVYVVPCCVSKDFEKEALGTQRKAKERGRLTVIFIGRLDSYKRVDWLLDSVERATEAVDDKHCIKVNIIGNGPKRAALEEQAIKAGIDATFWGQMNEEEKLKLIASSDLLVLPSDKCNEAFGIVQLEAMATGIPALAFNCAGSGMGWVCDLPDLNWNKNPEGLTDILQRLLKEEDLFLKISRQARIRYIELFSRNKWEKSLKQLTK